MSTFSLLTINCFGVPTPQTRNRLLALADTLNQLPLNMVCFQEVQSHIYRRLLLHALVRYRSSAFEPFLHAPKGGLLTVSRTPIEASDFTLYTARGLWYTPAMADWILHKGILCTRLMVGQVPVIVLNTHLNANYKGNWQLHSHYTHHEQSQLRQLADMVNVQPKDAIVVVAGDFNIPRGSWLYDEFLQATGLIDPLTGDQRPTYRARRGMPARYSVPIDFTFLRAPQLPGLKVESDLSLAEKIPVGKRQRLYPSDHSAVELRLTWNDTV
jgi:endonuclease/exonuclease/phosphatase family metal-dependent hydrolase